MNCTIFRINHDFRHYRYLSIGILGLLITSGCEDRVKIRQGDVEISIPRKEYEKSKALNEKFWRVPPEYMDKTPHPVKLPEIKQ
ncbi:MAG: hypothetical protein FDX30_10805 [Chlorobium sp.]|jgi:hypothetical protein|nr:MAG: hypothetical protein FDX30_10805 [Chlorobium sp.]